MNGTNVHWLIFGLIDALRDEDPRISVPTVGCTLDYEMLGGTLTMSFGCPYEIEIGTHQWLIKTGISGQYEACVFESTGDMRQCSRELTILKLMLPQRATISP